MVRDMAGSWLPNADGVNVEHARQRRLYGLPRVNGLRGKRPMTARRHLPSELVIGVVGPYDLVERIMLSGAAARDDTFRRAVPATRGSQPVPRAGTGAPAEPPAAAGHPARGRASPGSRWPAARARTGTGPPRGPGRPRDGGRHAAAAADRRGVPPRAGSTGKGRPARRRDRRLPVRQPGALRVRAPRRRHLGAHHLRTARRRRAVRGAAAGQPGARAMTSSGSASTCWTARVRRRGLRRTGPVLGRCAAAPGSRPARRLSRRFTNGSGAWARHRSR